MSMSIAELRNHRKEIEIDMLRMEKAHSKIKTSHILHLLLSLCTGGLWVIIWLIVALSNSRETTKLVKSMAESQRCLIDIDQRLIPEAIDKQDEGLNMECPWCSEKILKKAKVCKHCGRDVVSIEHG